MPHDTALQDRQILVKWDPRAQDRSNVPMSRKSKVWNALKSIAPLLFKGLSNIEWHDRIDVNAMNDVVQ